MKRFLHRIFGRASFTVNGLDPRNGTEIEASGRAWHEVQRISTDWQVLGMIGVKVAFDPYRARDWRVRPCQRPSLPPAA